ncbi:MAG: M48 family metalloprotease [Candidatus Bathyarchaeia archaeon]
MNFEDVLVQVFQPYFYYSVIVLAISFICIKIIVRCFPFIGSKTKSLIYLIPVVAPLFVMFSFPPKIVIQAVSSHLIGSFSIPVSQGPMLFSPFHFMQSPSPQAMLTVITLSTNQILSITGILCITGLALGGIYAVTTILVGDWVASRLLHVIDLGSNEYEWLQTEIAKISKKLSVPTPRVALVEDLRPNAFTMGYGRKTKLVFTVGILNILNKEEILAVASHELAHVQNRDFLFKTLSNALTAVSFFNPIAFFALFNSQREREMLADENGAKLIQKPSSLANALTKITAALQSLPREGSLIRITSNLLVTSPIIHRPQILSGHPKIDLRLRNINQLTTTKTKKLKPSKIIVSILLTSLIIVAGVTTTLALVNFQSGYVTPKTVLTSSAYVGAAYIKGVSTNSINTQIVLINSKMTFNPLGKISSLQNSNLQIISQYHPAQLNEVPRYNLNQEGCIPSQTSLFSSGNSPSSKIAIIYSLTNENGTTLIVKY